MTPIERSQIERWLREDLGHHDVTNDVPGETTGRLVATESGIAAGIDAAAAVFEYLDVGVTDRIEAGETVEAGDAVLRVEGDASAVLRGERVAVNVAGHASGVATRTRRAVEAAREVSDEVRIAGTRKTTPGLRGVEKRAVAAGGGDTHRLVPTLDPDIGYHYAAAVPSFGDDESLTVRQAAPCQLARHEGYETAFFSVDHLEF